MTSSPSVSSLHKSVPKTEIGSSKLVLESSGFSISSDALTTPMLAISDIPPLDSDHPNWLRNVKSFAQTKVLSAISDLTFNQSIFEQML